MRFPITVFAVAAAFLGLAVVSPAHAASSNAPKKGVAGNRKPAPESSEDTSKIGYSNTEIQLNGMMVPIRAGSDFTYQPLTLRLKVAPGETERAACYMVPIIHEKMLIYLASAKLEPGDFTGERRDVLAKTLLDIASKTTDHSYYTGVELVDETTPALDSKSQTLSSQCR